MAYRTFLLSARRLGTRIATCAAVVLVAAPAIAQDYPNKPIRLIVPYTTGGVTDTGARVVAEQLGARLGQSVVVDNRPGASGNIGTQAVATAPADGYTLLLGFDGTLVINPHVFSKVPFDPVKDFSPVSKIGDADLVIVVHPSVPAKNFNELVAYAKSRPEGLSYGSSGTGSTPHLAGEMLKLRSGANFVHVPYRGGGQAMTDLVGGTLPMLYTAVASALPFIQRGQIRAIAVSGVHRSPSLPDVKTIAESGLPGFDLSSWIGILAPAKTPQPIIDKLQREVKAVVETPAIRDRLASLGITASGNTSAEFGQQIRADLQKYQEVVKKAGLSIE